MYGPRISIAQRQCVELTEVPIRWSGWCPQELRARLRTRGVHVDARESEGALLELRFHDAAGNRVVVK